MLYQINDGTVSFGDKTVLSHINFEVKGNEKIAIVGRNGAGKTTLLNLIAGKLNLDRDDKRSGAGIWNSRKLMTGMLSQQFEEENMSVEEFLLSVCPLKDTFSKERFEYEMEFDRMFTGFGLKKEDKKKKLSEFSGGERTKISFIHLLLQKPDLMLLDEPTNHLDLESLQWLEDYLKRYDKAVIMVSHDRFFLDQTINIIYELEDGKLNKYYGNYTEYKKQKRKKYEIEKKAFDRQAEEEKRLKEVIEKFKNKPKKAAFARAKKKYLERMPKQKEPVWDYLSMSPGEIIPLISGSKNVCEIEKLKIGYEKKVIREITFRIRKGQKIALIGANGSGKTTFLKTISGDQQPVSGKYTLGNQITIGYFDQNTAAISSEKTVLEHFHELFPAMTDKETRKVLSNYLFCGGEVQKKVSVLSGGEKSRLVLAEILTSRPNFLILDEPTNHMDLRAKEVLEAAFKAYQGTILFVSHDRYFISQVADSLLLFDENTELYYPFGYEHYIEKVRKNNGESIAAQIKAEEQALIAGLRSVPKAERHQLKEIPTDIAYFDWKYCQIRQKLEKIEYEVELLYKEKEEMIENIINSEAFWNTENKLSELCDAELEVRIQEALKAWYDCCIAWYDIYEEQYPVQELIVQSDETLYLN